MSETQARYAFDGAGWLHVYDLGQPHRHLAADATERTLCGKRPRAARWERTYESAGLDSFAVAHPLCEPCLMRGLRRRLTERPPACGRGAE